MTSRAETCVPTFAAREAFDLHEPRPCDGLHDELGDAIADCDVVAVRAVGVEKRHPNFPAVAGIHCSRAVHDRETVLSREPTARNDESDEAIGKGDRDARTDSGALARGKGDRLSGMQVGTSIARVRILRHSAAADQNLDHFNHVSRLMQISGAIDPCCYTESGYFPAQ
jgi:hypothetical protein